MHVLPQHDGIPEVEPRGVDLGVQEARRLLEEIAVVLAPAAKCNRPQEHCCCGTVSVQTAAAKQLSMMVSFRGVVIGCGGAPFEIGDGFKPVGIHHGVEGAVACGFG